MPDHRTAALVFAVSLALWGLVGMRAPVRAAGGQSLPVVPTAAWTPTPQAGLSRVLAPGETFRVLSVEQWRAVRDLPYALQRSGWCEGHFDPDTAIIDVDGLWRFGAWSVGPTWFGPVPRTLRAQAEQVAGIYAEYGMQPWRATEHGCPDWNS